MCLLTDITKIIIPRIFNYKEFDFTKDNKKFILDENETDEKHFPNSFAKISGNDVKTSSAVRYESN